MRHLRRLEDAEEIRAAWEGVQKMTEKISIWVTFYWKKFIYSKGDGIIDSFTESFLNVLTIITLLMAMYIFFTIF